MQPLGEVPEDVYAVGNVVPAPERAPFTKKLDVYGLQLAAEDEASDDFLRLTAQTVVEIGPTRSEEANGG
ncbi:MAG: hypothetical protein AAGK22_21790 [Acidobacteriota bacterium]